MITALPPAPQRTDAPAVFIPKADAFVAALSPFATELNALQTDVTTKQGLATQAAADADADRVAAQQAKVDSETAKTTSQFAADKSLEYRNTAKTHADAAAASAQTIGTTAAFSDANPIAKNSADITKLFRVSLSNITTGTTRVVTLQNRDGTMALTDDPDIIRFKTYFDANTSLTIDYTNGIHQRWAPGTGAKTLTISNWPAAGTHAELMIEGIGLGGATITWPTYIWWLRYDGTYSQAFSYTLASLQAGTASDFIVLWSREGSTRVFGKVVR